MQRVASGTMTSYGSDEITERVRKRVSEIFNRDVDVFPVLTGTVGNALGLATLTPPWGAVFCHEDAHIQRDELGATEFMSGGAKLITIPGEHGKLHPEALERSIIEIAKSKITAIPAVVSLTNATEAGTLYTNDEVRALIGVARRHKLRVQLDGARIANAYVGGATNFDDIDIMTLGATKNGSLTADLVVVFRRELANEFRLRWQRAGQRASKMRFLSAQLDAYFSNDLWLRNARHANAMARRLRDAIQDEVEIVMPVEANVVFARCAPPAGFLFYDWPIFGPDVYRIVMGFATDPGDVDALAQSVVRSRSVAT